MSRGDSQNLHFDVVVVGGGPSGIGAALGAARTGAKVALLERHPYVGGMGTAALVNNFCLAHWDGERIIIGGVFRELRERLITRHALYTVGATRSLEPYDPEVFVDEVNNMMSEAGVTVLLNTQVEGLEQSELGAVVVLHLADGRHIEPSVVIDATGDAQIAAESGVPYTVGRENDGAVMPLTYCYSIGPVDLDVLFESKPECERFDPDSGEHFVYLNGCQAEIAVARERGELTIPRENLAVAVSIPGKPTELSVNFGRVDIEDPTDAEAMDVARVIGIRQMEEGERFFRKYISGFENAEIKRRALQIGVRQSRQIKGHYCLTGDDILKGKQFADVIAQSHYGVDIHEPGSSKTTLKSLPKGLHYDIPLRCLIPQSGPDNLLLAGRAISATHEAMSSLRVSPSVMAIGEAAGVAAALAVRHKMAFQDLSYDLIKNTLEAGGAILT